MDIKSNGHNAKMTQSRKHIRKLKYMLTILFLQYDRSADYSVERKKTEK